MEQWWGSISSFEKIFWFFALPFTSVFILQMILTFTGIDGHDVIDDHGDIDFHHDADFLSGFRLFTLRNFIIFFTGFGWAGIFGVHAGFGQVATVFLAFLTGFILMITVAGIFYLMTRLTQSGNISITNALNASGRVYLPIPARRSGLGQIQLTIQGAVREIEAMTDEELLPAGTPVTVTEVLNDEILIVKKAESKTKQS